MLNSFKNINTKKILEIANKYGVSNLRVFGSYAKGTNKKGSDLDLLYTSKRNFSLLKHAALELELTRLLKIKVQLVSDKALSSLIKKEVINSSIKL
ncbi:MAG: nucleotidyltransferase domain-containing protein [Rickettsiales bacterium]|nr:nucleotidyltransferase domain-containing protein [Rickettsiales bacterium]